MATDNEATLLTIAFSERGCEVFLDVLSKINLSAVHDDSKEPIFEENEQKFVNETKAILMQKLGIGTG